MTSNGAAKRLRKELQNLERSAAAAIIVSAKRNNKTNEENANSSSLSPSEPTNSPHHSLDDDVYLRPSSSSSILQWTALIRGPPDTPYENGIFRLMIRCGTDYPLAPPSIAFETKIFHPNVHFRTGDVCLDILKKEWSPAWGLQAACRAVVALLGDPDADSPLNCDAGNMIRGGDMLAYYTTAKMYTEENARDAVWPTSMSPICT